MGFIFLRFLCVFNIILSGKVYALNQNNIIDTVSLELEDTKLHTKDVLLTVSARCNLESYINCFTFALVQFLVTKSFQLFAYGSLVFTVIFLNCVLLAFVFLSFCSIVISGYKCCSGIKNAGKENNSPNRSSDNEPKKTKRKHTKKENSGSNTAESGTHGNEAKGSGNEPPLKRSKMENVKG